MTKESSRSCFACLTASFVSVGKKIGMCFFYIVNLNFFCFISFGCNCLFLNGE